MNIKKLFTREPKRTEHVVEHEGQELAYVLPAYAGGTAEVCEKIESDGFRIPTFRELLSIIHHELSYNNRSLRETKKLLKSRFFRQGHTLFSSTKVYTVPGTGAYIVEDSTGEQLSQKDLEEKLNVGDGSVKFVPDRKKDYPIFNSAGQRYGGAIEYSSPCEDQPFSVEDEFCRALVNSTDSVEKILEISSKLDAKPFLVGRRYYGLTRDIRGSPQEGLVGLSIGSEEHNDIWGYGDGVQGGGEVWYEPLLNIRTNIKPCATNRASFGIKK